MENAKVNKKNESETIDVVSNNSLMDFLKDEECCENVDEVRLFSEINRLAGLSKSKFTDENDDRTIEELLKEAESLINQPIGVNNANYTISSNMT
ncbi:CLUMA_CG003616, isoform A [Clunio marinus]|uniref:CLUMA_CG003616, isoform A n=1 Tax=Clunio marinus TaxID=568069 RepID=A0A1J1HNR5_9DIPT|nr:CLUMA_CG003616, isoform A [Clunio marinus]